MEIRKPEIQTIPYDEFKNNDYLEKMAGVLLLGLISAVYNGINGFAFGM